MWLDDERNSSIQRFGCCEECFNFHSHSCLILFSRHSPGRQHCVHSAQLCARPDKGPDKLLSQQGLTQPCKSCTEGCLQLLESYALPKQPLHILMQGKAIGQHGAYCRLDGLGILAQRTELLFDRVCMRESRALCKCRNLPYKHSMKGKSIWLNLIFSWTQSKRQNNVNRTLWPANRQCLCVRRQHALLMMAVKTNQTEEQLKSILQVFRLYIRHKEALRKPLGKFYC